MESAEDNVEDSLCVSMVKSIDNMLNILGGADELRKFIDDHRDKIYTVFDFDWSKDVDDVTHYKNMMLATLRDINKETPEALLLGQKLEYLIPFLPSDNKLRKMFEDPKHREFLLELWPRVSPNCCIAQAFQDGEKTRTMTFSHPATKPVNHSCDPNIYINAISGALIFTICQPIKRGTEIRTSPIPCYNRTKEMPEVCFDNQKSFCVPCKNNWAKMISINSTTYYFRNTVAFNNRYPHHDPKQLSTKLCQLKGTADFINKNFDGYYSNAEKRHLIALKKDELKMILFSLGNPFPASEVFFLTWKPSEGIEGFNQLKKVMHFDT